MHKTTQIATTIALIAAIPAIPAWSATIFVNASNANPTQNGDTWATAYSTLTPALNEAGPNDEVWVAQGIYIPSAIGDRNASFVMSSSMKLRGGFVPGAISPNEADPVAHPTILSGEIGGPGIADNTFHVLAIIVGTPQSLLDGFTITGANATPFPNDTGGGLDIGGSSTRITRCTIINNHSSGPGAGIQTAASSPVFVDCDFISNHSSDGPGGAADLQGGSPRFLRCRFHGNTAATGGGVRFLNSGLPANRSGLFSCILDENSSQTSGGGVDVSAGNVEVNGCTIVRNHASTGRLNNQGGGGIFATNSAAITLRNTIVTDNTSDLSGEQQQVLLAFGATASDSGNCITGLNAIAPFVGAGNINADPQFLDPDGPDNILGTFDDGFTLHSISPCIDSADGAQLAADFADLDLDLNTAESQPMDFVGNFRVRDDLANDAFNAANSALDMGALEFDRPGVVWCVDKNATGNSSGLTWKDAFTSLHTALGSTNDPDITEPIELWIADGVYPTTTGTDRTVAYFIPDDVYLFGSFAGGERSRSLRNIDAHPTILTGEIGGPSLADNAHHVVAAISPLVNSSILDGLIITRGNADGGSVAGGGPETFGGGVLVQSGASLRLQNCRLIDNHAISGGAVGLTKLSSATLLNCTATGNSAIARSGGALFQSHLTDLQVINCTIYDNVAAELGGGIALDASDDTCHLTLHNSILYNNKAGDAEGMDHQLASIGSPFVADLSHSVVQDFNDETPFGGTNMSKQDPLIADADGPDNIAGTVDDDFSLAEGSPCIDQGNNDLAFADTTDDNDDLNVFEPLPVDNRLQPRFLDDSGIIDIRGGSGDTPLPVIDIGAVEYPFDTPAGLFGDLNGDDSVDGADLGLLLGAWGTDGGVASPASADLNNDNTVDGADLGLLLGAWS